MDPTKETLDTGTQPGTDTTNYEFTEVQNTIIRELARRMKFIGVLNYISAVFATLGAIGSLVHSPLFGLVFGLEVAYFFAIGAWNYRGAASFRMVVDTRGDDISHLMKALTELRKLYNLQYWLMIISLVVAAIGIVLFLLFGMHFAK